MAPEAIVVPIKRLATARDLPLPSYQTDGSAGMDLPAALREELIIPPGAIRIVPTGISVAIPPGYEGQIRPRSGYAVRFGLLIPTSPATIDSDYRGELRIPVLNLTASEFIVRRGMRLAQLVIVPVLRIQWQVVTELDATGRNDSGLGENDEELNSYVPALKRSVDEFAPVARDPEEPCRQSP